MLNIYTVTFYKDNYGSVLQAYALQSKLKELNAKPYIVLPDIENNKTERISFYKKLCNFLKPEKHYGIVRKIKRYMQREIFAVKKQKILNFAENNIDFVSVSECISQVEKNPSCLLAGSDQIWNIIDRPINDLYLFGFLKKTSAKKYSYAASIGQEKLSDKQKEYYKTVLNDFEIVSFREKAAKKLLGDKLGDRVRIDIDPTLLQDKIFWDKIASKRINKERYIFIYMLRPDKRLIKMGKLLAKKTNCKIIYTGLFNYKLRCAETISDAGPEEFLSLIKNAEYVITNSFHGTVFSVLFEKKFVSVKIASTSSRAENLLNILHLQEHLITDTNDYKVIEKDIDYNEVNKKLNDEREKSVKYLENIISENKGIKR